MPKRSVTTRGTRRAKKRRRSLRRDATTPEQLLWGALRGSRMNGLKFRRQCTVGPFIVDFVCPERMLIVEVDGAYHDHVFEKDCRRQRFLERQGYTVLRFENDDVMDDVEAVTSAILRWVQ